jgi:hypothetical protein
MKFKNIRREDGGVTFDVATTDQEVLFLVNHAVSNLLMEGVIAINVKGPSEQDVDLPKEQTLQ